MKAFLLEISEAAGRIAMDFRSRLATLDIHNKSAKDMVTEADVAVEKYLVEQIQNRYPDHGILGEESGTHAGNVYRWIIDPIDGTASFIHGQPFFAVSIAVEKDGQMILGAVNAPVLQECFFAERGHGATCNGNPIHVSTCTQLIESMVGTGFACMRNDHERNNLPYFNKIMPKIRGVRRLGSVAIDLSYVASARLDAFWELGLHLYDIAAASLILEEAGGQLTDFSGGKSKLPGELVGTNGLLHASLLELIETVDKSQ